MRRVAACRVHTVESLGPHGSPGQRWHGSACTLLLLAKVVLVTGKPGCVMYTLLGAATHGRDSVRPIEGMACTPPGVKQSSGN